MMKFLFGFIAVLYGNADIAGNGNETEALTRFKKLASEG
jgi:hypothetical protein